MEVIVVTVITETLSGLAKRWTIFLLMTFYILFNETLLSRVFPLMSIDISIEYYPYNDGEYCHYYYPIVKNVSDKS